jgi:hypothetical protein
MKVRLLLLVCLAISISLTLQSQTLVKENNLWSNLMEVTPGNFTFHYQKIQGDTTFDTKSYKKLLGTSNTQLTNWTYEAALRETEPGKVYIKKAGPGIEHLLYDFNITVNDTFTGFYNECEYKMKLTSTEDKMLMNGEIRKIFNFTGIASFFYSESWLKEIGSDNGLTSAGVYSCTTDIYPTLNCFTENSIVKVYNNADFPCYSLVGLIDNPPAYKSGIIPNPVIDVATLQLQETNFNDLTMLIIDSHGKEVARYYSNKGKQIIFNREALPGGFYYYVVYSGSEQISNGKFIVR